MDDDTLDRAASSQNEFDLFTWGWVPFVDPDPQLSLLHHRPAADRSRGRRLQRRQLVQRRVRRAVRAAEQSSSIPPSAHEIVQQMLKIFYEEAPYAVLYKYDDLQAIRSDRWENFVRQPKDTGPVLFTNTSPGVPRPRLQRGRRRSTTAAGPRPMDRHRCVGVAAVAIGAVVRRRGCGPPQGRATTSASNELVSLRLVLRKLRDALVLLAMRVSSSTSSCSASSTAIRWRRYRGRSKLSRSNATALIERFGLDGSKWEQFVKYISRTRCAATSVAASTRRQPVSREILDRLPNTLLLVGISTVLTDRHRAVDRHRAGWRRGSTFDKVSTPATMVLYAHARVLPRHAVARRSSAPSSAGSRPVASATSPPTTPGSAQSSIGSTTSCCRWRR